MTTEQDLSVYKTWTPAAQEKALRRIQELTAKEWRPFYCPIPTCNGMPHDDWTWNHARVDQRPPTDPDWLVWLLRSGRGAGKALALDTRLATPTGWVEMGSVRLGDRLFDEDGTPTTVTATFDVMPTRAWLVEFSDGTTIRACGDHQWVVQTHRDRKQANRQGVDPNGPGWAKRPQVTTDWMAVHVTHGKREDRNLSIPVAGPLELPHSSELTIDPYVLGYWLGDGSSNGAEITVGDQDLAWVRETLDAVGEPHWERWDRSAWRVSLTDRVLRQPFDTDRASTFRGRLRESRVLGRKHVPAHYHRASIVQRTALLNGLMDSDGSVSRGRSSEFTATNYDLALDILELARSLGRKPTIGEGRATIDGRDCGPKWRVCWRARPDDFRMPRKRAAVVQQADQQSRNHHRMVVAITPIEPEPMRCVTVDSPNSMYLAGDGMIPTHNTRTGTEFVHKATKKLPRIALIAGTATDAREVMLEGISGILTLAPPNHRPLYEPSKKRLTWPNGSIATIFCVSDDTEALTRSGWKRHDELVVGEDIRTLDTTTGMARWSPADAVNVFGVEDHDMISMEGNMHSSLVTSEHRWPVRNVANADIRWRESGWDINTKDSLLLSAPDGDTYSHRRWRPSRNFAELVGWYTAEGNVRHVGEYGERGRPRRMQGGIVQSHVVNPAHTGRIRHLLSSLYGAARADLSGVRVAAWSETMSGRMTSFNLSHELLTELQTACPGVSKVTTAAFVAAMRPGARRAFIEGFCKADGHQRGKAWVIAQSVRERLDALEFAAIMEGYAVSWTDTGGVAVLTITKSQRGKSLRPAFKNDIRTATTYTGNVWCPTTRDGTWLARRNGTVYFTGNSAEEPDRLRGPEHYFAWLDEPAHWPLVQECWDNLLFGLRLGDKPRILCTTTPKTRPWLKELMAEPTTRTVSVSTYTNIDNLSDVYAQRVINRYEGTRLGRQELYGEMLTDVEGALWSWEMIEENRRPSPLRFDRILVGIDPAGSHKKTSDETGIVVAGSLDGEAYILDDASGRYTPSEWANKAKHMYEQYSADAFVVERNFGGDMVLDNMRNHGIDGRVIETHSSRGKELRAEPIVGLYEQGKVHHRADAGDRLVSLETQMTEWVPNDRTSVSPDRVDAMVFCVTELIKHKAIASVSNPANLRLVG